MERRISVGIFRPKHVDHLQAEISEIFGIMERSQCVYWNQGHPDKENQSDGGNVPFSHPANQMPHLQIQPIKYLVQHNEISSCSLWYIRSNGAVY